MRHRHHRHGASPRAAQSPLARPAGRSGRPRGAERPSRTAPAQYPQC
jgi:hypothetical protein